MRRLAFCRIIVFGCSVLILGLSESILAADKSVPPEVPPRRSTQLSAGFGVNLPLPRDPRLPWTRHWWTSISDSGVKWVRLGQYENSSDKTSWDWVEQSPGVYSVRPEVDEAIRSLSDNGILIELQLCYSNALYESDSATRPKHVDPAPPGVGDQDKPPHPIFDGLRTEEEIEAFLNYTRFMVSRYKGKIKSWELWNEANIGYWQPNVESKEERAAKGREYGHALCRFADVVHELDPQSKVIFGGTSEVDAPFALAAMSECPSKIDVMAYHPYPGYGGNSPPEEADALEDADLFREAVQRLPGVRQDIEFWENEWNVVPAWKNSNESVQARYVPRFFLEDLAAGVKPFIWEFIPGTDGNEQDQFGLLHGETFDKKAFQPRAAYHAFEVTSALFGQTEVDPMADILLEPPQRYNQGQVRKYAYRDRASGKRIYAVWLAVVSDPADQFVPAEVKVGFPHSGIRNPILIDVRTGRVTPLVWVNRETETLKIPLKDSVVAVTDSSYLSWPEAPEAPGELAATLFGRDVHLQWRKYGNPSGFEVQRSRDWGTWEKVAELQADQLAYKERIPQGAHITYRVRSLAPQATSAWANPAWVDPAP
jgi:hypothetical protein